MSERYDRHCHTADGRAKRRWATRAEARAHAKLVPDGLNAYRCPTCGWFHVGHYPTNPRTRRKLRAGYRTSSSYRKAKPETENAT